MALGGSAHRPSFVQFWGRALRGSQNESECEQTANWKTAENRVEAFTELGHSVPALRPAGGLNRSDVFSCRVILGSVEALKM